MDSRDSADCRRRWKGDGVLFGFGRRATGMGRAVAIARISRGLVAPESLKAVRAEVQPGCRGRRLPSAWLEVRDGNALRP